MQRIRPKESCQLCRERKRKCDGGLPCDYCSRHDCECFYDQPRRNKRTHRPRQHSVDATKSPESPDNGKKDAQLQLLETNSPAVFVRRLALKMNASAAPRLNCYAWNIGLA